jgi:integrase
MSEQAASLTHDLLGGKVHVYKRPNSACWQCSTYLAGKNHRKSTKEESLAHAKQVAEDWYLSLKGKYRSGDIIEGHPFRAAAERFRTEYETLMQGYRNAQYIKDHSRRIDKNLLPFFGKKVLPEITPALIQEYRIHRRKQSMEKLGRPPARQTIHQEIVTLRMILKAAVRLGWMQYVPDLSEPFRGNGKVSHRAWFSPEEYKQLYAATRKRAADPPKERWRWSCEQLHDYVLFMVNTGLRPDEAARLQFRDVTITDDESTDETILVIAVRGKRGTGFCKSMNGAVVPFERLKARLRIAIEADSKRIDPKNASEEGKRLALRTRTKTMKMVKPQPNDLIFPNTHHELFNIILEEEELKFDREGQRRTSYSLRHSYISMRLMEGADIYQIAKNCRTSVEMIQKFYASHIANTLDAAAINVRRSKPSDKKEGKSSAKSKKKKR